MDRPGNPVKYGDDSEVMAGLFYNPADEYGRKHTCIGRNKGSGYGMAGVFDLCPSKIDGKSIENSFAGTHNGGQCTS